MQASTYGLSSVDDISMCKRLFAEKGVLLLPGQYLGRTLDGRNPGENRVRIALVELSLIHI